MKFLRYGLVLSSLLITSLLSAGYPTNIIPPSKSLAQKNISSFLQRIKAASEYDALMVKVLFGEDKKLSAYLHVQKDNEQYLENFLTDSDYISSQELLDLFINHIEQLIIIIARNTVLSESKAVLEVQTKKFKADVMSYFTGISPAHQEEEYFKIALCNAVSRVNPVIFINLLMMYKDVLYASKLTNISPSILEAIKGSKKSYNASRNIKSTVVSQVELSEDILDWDNDAFLYAYLRATFIDQQKDMVLYLIENNKITHPIVGLFFDEYGTDKQIARDNSSDLKEVLEALVEKLAMFEGSFLCSYAFDEILIKAKKTAELLGNDPSAQKIYVQLARKILIKDEHIETGDVRSGTPRGLHVFKDEKTLVKDLNNDPFFEKKYLADVRVESPDKKLKTANMCMSKSTSHICIDTDAMVYNPKNGVTCSPVFAETCSLYSFDLHEDAKKHPAVAQSKIKDPSFGGQVVDNIAKKLHLDECEIQEVVGNNVICLGKSIKKKGHTSSFYDKKFNNDIQSLFKLIASAVDGYPIWSKNVSLDIDGKVLGIENISKNSGVICVVSDVDGHEHVIEIYFKAHKKYPSLVTVVSAFEHAFPFVYETENLPEAIAIGPDLGTTCHLLPNAMCTLNSQVSTLVKTELCKGTFPSLSGTCIPLCNINLADYYQGIPDGFGCDVSFLARIPENKMEELYAQWGNENYLRLALKDYSDFPTIVELKNMLLKENETAYCLLKGSKLDTLRNMIHAFIVSCSAQLKERKGNALLEMYFDDLSQFVETPRYHCNMKKLLLAINKSYRDKLLIK